MPNRITFQIKPIPPFRLDLTAWALRRQPTNMMDRFDGGVYQRILMVRRRPVKVYVVQAGPIDEPRIRVEAEGSQLTGADASLIRLTLNKMLGLRIDLSEFYEKGKNDSAFGELIERFRGVKPPRFPTVFEAIASAIACQQLSLSAGIALLNRLSENYGAKIDSQDAAFFAFPTPTDLAHRQARSLRKLGFSVQKSRNLIRIASDVAMRRIDLEATEDMTDVKALEYLDKIPGIGRWSSEYILLRGLGRVHIFPGDDVGARNGLKRLLNLGDDLDYDGVKQALVEWKDYGGMMYFHLRLNQLEKSGYIRP
jgi:DNA-3-methyladenine glycosylase II